MGRLDDFYSSAGFDSQRAIIDLRTQRELMLAKPLLQVSRNLFSQCPGFEIKVVPWPQSTNNFVEPPDNPTWWSDSLLENFRHNHYKTCILANSFLLGTQSDVIIFVLCVTCLFQKNSYITRTCKLCQVCLILQKH